ncbi:MAG: SRPBCC domain-containing protein, partial [Bdellovibrionota bacterium]
MVEKIGMYKSDSVKKHTRKTWDEWISILTKAGAERLEHGEIANLLKKKYKLTNWWQHVVAGGFEIHIGRKVEGRNAKGRWSLTATKSIHYAAGDVWKFLVSDEGQRTWLRALDPVTIEPKTTFETDDGFFGEIRTMKKGERVRLSWNDPDWDRHSFVQMYLVKRPAEKCLVAFMHTDLPDASARDRLRQRWKDVLDALVGALSV